MNWKHVKLIFLREMTDQLRDRRTLFTITVLPILLYPLIGMLMLQIAQFNREHPVRVRLIGMEHWPAGFPLLDQNDQLIYRNGEAEEKELVEFDVQAWPAKVEQLSKLREQASQSLAIDEVDAILLVEPEFEQLLRKRLEAAEPVEADSVEPASEGEAPRSGLQVITNLARDRSQIALRRLETMLDGWQDQWISEKLAASGISPRLVEPLGLERIDTAPKDVRRAMLWSKLLPFVMLVWALTGAFYPAVDLCAGEKERGTLETLLSSPARRREIVWGKLGAISVFSVCSALLNLLSMHLTAGIIVRQLASQGTAEVAEALGPLPLHAFGWLVLLLLPMAAFFSALALAVAALARSTKEGQYYLMPLLLVTLPLVALPMIPSLELSLGTSLVPVSGAVFLVRALIEARYTDALIHLPVVLLVTAGCCALAVRWAISQFESEAVMFRESERWNLRLWLRHLWRDRGETASAAEAMLCGVIILIGMFFAQFVAGSSISSWESIVQSTITVQLGLILAPCLLMAVMLTRSIRTALRIHRTQLSHVAAAVLLGVALHPSYMLLGESIQRVYEVGGETALVLEYFQNIVMAQPLWAVLMLMACLPAVCEELAFRGFILGGLLKLDRPLRAVVVSSLFFGFTHTLLQQSIAATIMGLILGLIAWRTGGVLCTIIVHAINNTLSLSLAWCSHRDVQVPPGLQWAVVDQGEAWSYDPAWITLSVTLAVAMLIVLFIGNQTARRVVQTEMV